MSKPSTSATVFSSIYERNDWKSESRSGPGSTLDATKKLRGGLTQFFDDYYIKTLLDVPCGDSGWISQIIDPLDIYLGIDVVPKLLEQNIKTIKNPNAFFRQADIIHDRLPKADALLCRDCLVHLPLADAKSALNNMQLSGARFILLTTFPTVQSNDDIVLGSWRPLNMEIAPFNLGVPLVLINERDESPADKFSDKSIGVWLMS